MLGTKIKLTVGIGGVRWEDRVLCWSSKPIKFLHPILKTPFLVELTLCTGPESNGNVLYNTSAAT